jgi:membrane-associated protease RseP (regulator of RpoE activity)
MNGTEERHTSPFPEHPPVTGKVKKPGSGVRLNIILFLATVGTTLFAGALLDGADIFSEPLLIYRGIPFAVSLLLILGVHEAAHYIAARRRGLSVTLPYFIPFPSIIGTMGAVIRIKSPIRNRRALLEIGAAGPLAGFLVSLPIAVLGLKLSEATQAAVAEGESFSLGASLLFAGMVHAFGPAAGEGAHIVLHPVAFAAWVGFLVTSINLLPIGQLDGGHIICALFGRHHRYIAGACLVLLIPLGFLWPGWLIWAVLLIFMGWRHPPVMNSFQPLSRGHRLAGFLALAVLVLTFTPAPFSFS